MVTMGQKRAIIIFPAIAIAFSVSCASAGSAPLTAVTTDQTTVLTSMASDHVDVTATQSERYEQWIAVLRGIHCGGSYSPFERLEEA
ncbi:MAG: hypothetical protein ACKORY_02380, partial [Actinomycetota bacterium]